MAKRKNIKKYLKVLGSRSKEVASIYLKGKLEERKALQKMNLARKKELEIERSLRKKYSEALERKYGKFPTGIVKKKKHHWEDVKVKRASSSDLSRLALALHDIQEDTKKMKKYLSPNEEKAVLVKEKKVKPKYFDPNTQSWVYE